MKTPAGRRRYKMGTRQSAPYKKTPRRESRGAVSYTEHYTPKRRFVK